MTSLVLMPVSLPYYIWLPQFIKADGLTSVGLTVGIEWLILADI